MIRALDWNDTYLNLEPGHPSDNISATLAVAESENKSGQDFILSTILAYELHCRLCDAAGIRKKGWDHDLWFHIQRQRLYRPWRWKF